MVWRKVYRWWIRSLSERQTKVNEASFFMKQFRRILFLLSVLLGVMVVAARSGAQTLMTLHSFTNSPDGAFPQYDNLILSGRTLYGTASQGGNAGNGTVFAVSTNGTGFTNLYSFTATTYDNNTGRQTNSDGSGPAAGLILSGNNLYGTAVYGGSSAEGSVFAVTTDGTVFTNLHSFAGYPEEGANPDSRLVLSGNTLFGTTSEGGINGAGTVFAVNIDGTGFTNLYQFQSNNYNSMTGADTNGSGANPIGGLVLSGNTLYGTTEYGGISSWGGVFAINKDGTDFTNLHNFGYSDGAYPYAGLLLSGNTLYGTANQGGLDNKGTVFAMSITGTNFTILHSFTNGPSGGGGEYPGGFNPAGGLIFSGNSLYGTVSGGGQFNSGAIFSIGTNGSGFTNLYSFTPAIMVYNPATFTFVYTNSDGQSPEAGLILAGNTLYGTAYEGGNSADGTVFSLTMSTVNTAAPQLSINLSGNNLVLTWPTNATGYTLQAATNLLSPVWTTVTGQFAVTNLISGAREFFRLSQ